MAYCAVYLRLSVLGLSVFGAFCFLMGGLPAATNAQTLDGLTTRDALDSATMCGIGRGRKCDIQVAIDRGLFETGLRPLFPDGLNCRDIDEQWAINYTGKRDRENYHGGIDMPAPFGTPIIAAAAGTVVGLYNTMESYRGLEVVLRHSPEDTGLSHWIYTQYSHFDKMPDLKLGQRVKMGEELGPTGNSGRGRKAGVQSRKRRPAIHFAVAFTDSPLFVNLRHRVIVPVDGFWMDPNALYRGKPPFDSASMKALPGDEKRVPIPVMLDDGTVIPADTKLLWPYTCSKS